MFAIAARFTDLPNTPDNKMWEGGYEYAESARNILGLLLQYSGKYAV